MTAEPSFTAHPDTRIGHVHLTVSDLERSIRFYRDVLGFEVQDRWGDRFAFLGAGGYHHHVALNTLAGPGAPPPPPGRTGLFHVAILVPDRVELARVLRRVLDAGVRVTGVADHGVSEAIYLDDPDGNGIEVYRDRPRDEWPRDADGSIHMVTDPLDVDALLAEAAAQ